MVLLPYFGPWEPAPPHQPLSPGTVRPRSGGLQTQDWLPLPCLQWWSQARGLSEPPGSCWLAASDPLFGGSARATVTWWLVQLPEPIPEGPRAVLALCPTVTLLPSGSLWRLPASLPPINHVCRIYFLQQFISANAIWVCPQVGRMLCCCQSHGTRLYCQTDRHDSPAPRGRCTRALGWDARYSRDQPHPHVTATLASQAAWKFQLAPLFFFFFFN